MLPCGIILRVLSLRDLCEGERVCHSATEQGVLGCGWHRQLAQ